MNQRAKATLVLFDDIEFQFKIGEAQERYGISAVEIAKEFEVSTAAVRRWQNGKNSPVPSEQETIVRWLRERIAQKKAET